MAQDNLSGTVATSEPRTVTTQRLADGAEGMSGFCGGRFANADREASEARATLPVGIGVPDEFSVAFEDEDSIEIFRFAIQERILGIDRTVIAANAASKVAQNTRPSISPPLLV